MNVFIAPEIFTGVTKRGFLWRGILVILIGILIAVHPLFNLLLITMIAGWLFAIAGAWTLLGGIVNPERRIFWIVYGLVMGLWGVFMIFHPFGVNLVLAWFVAAWFVTEGVITIWNTAQSPASAKQKVVPVLSGLIGLFVGYAFFVWPLTSLSVIFWVAGLLLILEGLMLTVFSRMLPPPNA